MGLWGIHDTSIILNHMGLWDYKLGYNGIIDMIVYSNWARDYMGLILL